MRLELRTNVWIVEEGLVCVGKIEFKTKKGKKGKAGVTHRACVRR